MKKFIILLVTVIGCWMSATAQDIILLRTTEEIKATVTEITPTDVCYRKYGDKTGPLRRIGRDKIIYIKYANGEKEIFSKPEKEKPAETAPETALSATDKVVKQTSGFTPIEDYPYPVVRNRYSIGDLFDEDGVKGIVVAVTSDGMHGLIMSLTGTRVKFMEDIKLYDDLDYGDNLISADRNDGWKNQCAMAAHIDSHMFISWKNFPAFDWCRSLGEGWYLPAVDEMKVLSWCALSKSKPMDNKDHKKIFDWINNRSRQYDGDVQNIGNVGFGLFGFWSSTEYSIQNVHIYPSTIKMELKEQKMKLISPLIPASATQGALKDYKAFVRAFHKF